MATQTVTTTGDIPAVLEPYYTGTPTQPGLIPKAFEFYSRPYQAVYGTALEQAGLAGSGRVAGLSPYQQQVGTELAGMTTPGQFGLGSAYGQGAGNVFGALSGVQAPTVGIGSITNQGMLGAYMSPYMSQVVEQQKAAAQRDAQRAQLAQNLGAARSGSYGGA